MKACSLALPMRKKTQKDDSCIACHMPKARAYDGGHTVFTDHSIRRRQPDSSSRKVEPDSLASYFPPDVAASTAGRNLGIAWAQVRSVLLAYWRTPAFVLISMGLPVMFFVFFGLPNVGRSLSNGIRLGPYVLASLSAYAVSNVVVYNVGIGVANQRARKLDLLQRATPLPAWVAVLGNVVGGLILMVVSRSERLRRWLVRHATIQRRPAAAS